MRTFLRIVKFYIAAFTILVAESGFAHQLSTAYLNLETSNSGEQVAAQLQWRFLDLEKSIGLDSDLNGDLLWREVLENQKRIDDYLQNNLTITLANQFCGLLPNQNMQTDKHFDEGYLVIDFTVQCAIPIEKNDLQIHYQGIFEQDPNHKVIVNIVGGDADPSFSTVIDTDNRIVHFNSQNDYVYDTFITYLYQGIVHIFIGVDHILFLVVLMMTCVLFRENGKWKARSDFKQVFISAAWIVTAFTLAHSITLTATVLEWISPNSRWVEVGIAASVLLTAINNIWPIVLRLGWITFAFGLLHGMGFASVLVELGLSAEHQLVSILAFNLGVEVGQIAILSLVLPALFVLRHRQIYQSMVLKAGSLLIGLIALSWTVERL